MNTKTTILGVEISAITYRDALKQISQAALDKSQKYVCVCAVHLIIECQKNEQLKIGVNQSLLTTPDGMPLVWLSHLYGNTHTKRVYGPILMQKLCALSERVGWKVFLLGGSAGQGKKLGKILKKKYPQLTICGSIDTPDRVLNSTQKQSIRQHIDRAQPEIVFVGLGCPYQENWMIEQRPYIKSGVFIGVGAAFNFISGDVAQAPSWMQNHGLEWLFRLLQEPRRLAKRYIVYNTQFIYATMRQLIKDFILNT